MEISLQDIKEARRTIQGIITPTSLHSQQNNIFPLWQSGISKM